jgi:hypothetical protein
VRELIPGPKRSAGLPGLAIAPLASAGAAIVLNYLS